MQLLTPVLYVSNRHLQEVPKVTEVKNDKCEEMQQDSNVTLQSVKDQPQTTDNNSIHNKVIPRCTEEYQTSFPLTDLSLPLLPLKEFCHNFRL